MAPRVKYPEGVIRTPEQILAGQVVRKTTSGDECVWLTCWNCGGSGRYPSSMIPPGQCRLYCFQGRTPDTFGKLPVTVAKYVKRQQANDRRAYREELTRPAREAAEAAQRAERQARAMANLRDEAEREQARREQRARDVAGRVLVGTIGERVTVCAIVEKCTGMPGKGYMGGTRYLTAFRTTDTGSLVSCWSDLPPSSDVDWIVGDTVELRGTVKEQQTYRDEPQTVVQRVKLVLVARTGVEQPREPSDHQRYRWDERENYATRTLRRDEPEPTPQQATDQVTDYQAALRGEPSTSLPPC